jgi:hypothetical protein
MIVNSHAVISVKDEGLVRGIKRANAWFPASILLCFCTVDNMHCRNIVRAFGGSHWDSKPITA